MIYLDISTTRKYSGRPVGIVRCEIECIKYALDHETLPVAFCYYSKPDDAFFTVSRQEAKDLINLIVSSSQYPSPAGSNFASAGHSGSIQQPRLTLFKRFKKYIRMTGSTLIKKTFQPGTASELIQQIKNVITLQRETFRTISRVMKLSFSGKKKEIATPAQLNNSLLLPQNGKRPENSILFTPDDMFISMGLTWDYLDFADLYRCKMKYGFKIITVAYDTIPIFFREFSNGGNEAFGKSLLDQIWASDLIFCISDNTLKDLEKFIIDSQIPMRKLTRIHLGSFTREVKQIDQPKKFEKLVNPGEFVLFVSTMEPRKNHDLMFHVWRTLLFENFDSLVPLVMVGSSGWHTDDLRRKMALHRGLYPKYLVWGSDIDDSELDWLYQNCRFTVYPSFYEGWGLPVGESLERGKFCICSNTSSLPEVSQGFADEIHPLDFAGWKQRIAYYLKNDQALHEKEQHIKQTYSPVSWTDTYDKFFNELSEFQQSKQFSSVEKGRS